MAEQDVKQAFLDAILDADSLERFINGSEEETVLTRLSAEYPTLQNAISQINGKLDSADAQIKQSITTLFENGGLPATPFKTKAEMESSDLPDGSYAVVTDDVINSGLYIKQGNTWVQSFYDPYRFTSEALSSVVGSETLEPSFEIGSVSDSGTPIPSSNTARLATGVVKKSNTIIKAKSINPDIKIKLGVWGDNGALTMSDAVSEITANTGKQFIVLAQYSDGRPLTQEDIDTVITESVFIELGHNLPSRLSELELGRSERVVPLDIELGSFGTAIGNLANAKNRVRLKGFKIHEPNTVIELTVLNPELEVRYVLWDSDGSFTHVSDYGGYHRFIVEAHYNIIMGYKDKRNINIDLIKDVISDYIEIKAINTPITYIDRRLENISDAKVSLELHEPLELGTYFRGSGSKTPSRNRARTVEDRITLPKGSSVVLETLSEDLEINYGDWNDVGYYNYYQYSQKIEIDYQYPINYFVRFKDGRNITDEVIANYIQPNIRLKVIAPLGLVLDNISKSPTYKEDVQEDVQSVESIPYSEAPMFNSVPYGHVITMTVEDKQVEFDRLVSGYHGETKKELVGTSTSGSYDIYGYTLSPEAPTMTVAITMHTHGNEPYNPSGFFALLGEMQSGEPVHEFIKWLRDNVKWYVVPFVSPDAIASKSRNVDGINPNRNTDHDWAASGDRGDMPFSLGETKSIRDFFLDKRDEIDFHLDLHDIPEYLRWDASHRPAHPTGFSWIDEIHEVRDYLSMVNNGKSGNNYYINGGLVSGYFFGVLGVPSVTVEHSIHWWNNWGCTYDQHSAKALEQTVTFLFMFKHLYEKYKSYKGSIFYNRRFEMSFSSQEFGDANWTRQQRLNAFGGSELLAEEVGESGIFIYTPADYTKTILLVSGLKDDSGNSDFVVLRTLQRVYKGDEILLSNIKRSRIVVAPSLQDGSLDDAGVLNEINRLSTKYNPDYTVIVMSEAVGGEIGKSFISSNNIENITNYAKNNESLTPVNIGGSVYDFSFRFVEVNLKNASRYSHISSYDVADWVRIVANDLASFCTEG